MHAHRSLALPLLLLAALTLLWPLAASPQAEPPPPTVADITPDTACGAPSVGRYMGGILRYQVGGWRVDARGDWVRCTYAPPPPKGCSAPEVLRWSTGDVECRADGGQRIEHGATRLYRPPPGPVDGVLSLQCTDGRLAPLVAGVCSRVTWCEASSWRSTDDGGRTWISWSGRLAEGRIAYARREDGTRVRITCQDGRIRRAS